MSKSPELLRYLDVCIRVCDENLAAAKSNLDHAYNLRDEIGAIIHAQELIRYIEQRRTYNKIRERVV